MTWAERVKSLRTRLGLSIDGFSQLLGVTYHTVWGWERDKVPDATCPYRLIEMLEKNPDEGVRLLSQRFVGFGEETFGERVRRVRGKLGMSLARFSKLLGVKPGTVVNWEQGVHGADRCIGVLVDLLEHHLEDAAPLLWPDLTWRSIEEGSPDWVGERIWLLMEATGLASKDLGPLIRANPLTIEHWLHDRQQPAPCYSLLLWLLETYGPKAYFLMKDVPDDEWPPERVRALRKSLGLTITEMGEVLGITLGAYHALESRSGKDPKDACWRLVFSLLESKREEMIELLSGLPRLA